MEMAERNRIAWIDFSKGFAILMVIVGHTNMTGDIFWTGAIFSFHMPLFFILSGATFHYSTNIAQWLERSIKSFRQLLIPATMSYLIRSYLRYGFIPVKELLINLFWASGVDGEGFTAIGMVWFLFALFEIRSIMDLLHLKFDKSTWIPTIILTLLGIILGKHFWLPFSLDIAFASLLFFRGGVYAKRIIQNANQNNRITQLCLLSAVIYVTIYLFTVHTKHSFLELACRSYPYYGIIPYITAFAGTFSVCCFALIFEKYSYDHVWLYRTYECILYIGKNSFLLLIIHYFDLVFMSMWNISADYNICNVVFRVVIDVAILFFLLKMKTMLSHPKKQKEQFRRK